MTRHAVPRYFLYGEASQDVDEHFLHIESIAERSRLHNWTIQPHAHRDLQHLLLMLRGGGALQADGNVYELSAPSLIAVPLACVHGFEFRPDTDGWIITESAALLTRIVNQHPELAAIFNEASVMPLTASSATAMNSLATDLNGEFRASLPARHAAAESLLITILVGALRQKIRRAPSTQLRNPDSVLAARYRELIEVKYATPMSIAEYASRLRVSPERLRSACVRCTGCSPLALLNARRLLEAKRNLRYTNMSVAMIAEACGFRDPAYFSRFFAQQTGTSARAYRAERES